MGLGTMIYPLSICLILIAGALGAPTSFKNPCPIECKLDPGTPVPVYQYGQVYSYSYETTNVVGLPGTTNDEGKIQVSAIVEYSPLSPCQSAAKLSNVQLTATGKVRDKDLANFKSKLESNAFIVVLDHGQGHEICYATNEPLWVVNFKRGVVSTFIASPDRFKEKEVKSIVSDIHGHCITESKHASDTDGDKVIKTTKDLTSCTKNYGVITSRGSVAYTSNSPIQSPPALKSVYESEMAVKSDGIIKSVRVTETNLLKTLANGDKGVTTSSVISAKLIGFKEGTIGNIPAADEFKTGSIVYDYTVETSTPIGSAKDMGSAIRELCDLTKDDIRPEAANFLKKLQKIITEQKFGTLQTVYETFDSLCPSKVAKDIFYDAVAKAGSEGAVKLMVQVLSSGKISQLRARVWYTHLALITNPTAEVVKATLPILDAEAPEKSAFLGISALAHSHCRSNDCGKNSKSMEAISELTLKLERHIGRNCVSTSPEELNRIIVALKAFGNLGIVSGSALSKLTECIRTDSLPVEVRVAALEAFRRVPCVNQNVFWEILEDLSKDSEMSITAYLNLMRCPNQQSLIRIQSLLENNTADQVTSFIYTHLTNLQETSIQYKQAIKKIVSSAHLTKKFGDARKFSANYEISNYLRLFNLGGSLESNVIFSPSSFLPRSVSLNVTLDFFGESFNILELGVRATGLERKLESLFGPNGRNKNESFGDIVKSKLNDIVKGRIRRAAPFEHRKVKEFLEQSIIKPDDQVEVSISLKMAGNEISWLNARDFRKLAAEIGDRKSAIRNFIEKLAQEKSSEFGHGLVLPESTLVISSSSGIPIKMSIGLNAVVGLKANGHADFREYFAELSQVDIAGLIQPSASISADRSLVIDAQVTKCGLTLRRTKHFSHSLSGVYQREEGRKLKMSLTMPKNKLELFSGKNELIMIQNDVEQPISLTRPEVYHINTCTVYLQDFTGVKVCLDYHLPRPILRYGQAFPPLLPYSYDIILTKIDPKQKSIDLVWEDSIQENNDRKFELSFDTPGSEKRRTLSLALSIGDESGVNAHMITPFKQLQFKAGRTVRLDEHTDKTEWSVTVDESRKYSGFTKVYMAPGHIKAKMEVTTPSQKVYTLLKAEIDGEKVDYTISVPNVNAKITGTLGRSSTVNINAEFYSQSSPEIKHPFKGFLTNSVSDDWNMHTVGWQMLFPNSPEWNSKLHLEYFVYQEKNNKLDFQYGGNFDNPDQRLQAEWSFRDSRDGSFKNCTAVLKIKYPKRDIDFDHVSSLRYEEGRLFEHKLSSKNGLLFRSISSELILKNDTTEFMNYDVSWKVVIPDRELTLKYKVLETEKGAHEDLKIQWQKDEDIRMIGNIKDKGTESTTHYEADYNIKVYGISDPIKITGTLQCGKGQRVFNLHYACGEDKYHIDSKYIRTDEDNANLNVDINLPSVIVGKITGKHAGDSKSADVNINILENRRIQGIFDVKYDGVTRNVNLNLKLDADDDPNMKLVFAGTIKRPLGYQRIVEIDGSLQTPSKKVHLNVNYNIPEVLFESGHHVFKSQITYNNQKKMVIDLDVDIDKSEGRRVSEGKIKLITPYTDEITVLYKTRCERTEDVKALGARFLVSSPGLEDITFEISHQRGYRNVGGSIGFGFGDRVLKLGLGAKAVIKDGTTDVGFNIDIRTPIENAKAFVVSFDHYCKTTSDVGLIRHESKLILFDPAREVALKIDWDRRGNSKTGFSVKSHVNIISPFARLTSRQIDGRLNLEYNPSPKDGIAGDVDIILSEEKRIQANVHIISNEKGNIGHLFINAPHCDFKQLDIVLKNTRNHPNYETTLNVKWEPNKKLTYVVKGIFFKNGFKIDYVLNTPFEGYEENKMSLEANTENGQGALVLELGKDKKMTIKELFQRVDGGIENEITISSTSNLPVDGWRISTKHVRDIVKINLHLGEGRDVELNTNFKPKPEASGVEGTITVALNGDKIIDGKVDGTYKGTSWSTDKQQIYKVVIVNPYTDGPITIDFGVTKTVSDVILENKICSGEDCIYGEFGVGGIGTSDPEQGFINTTLAWKAGISSGQEKNTMGYYYRSFLLSDKVELESKMIYHEEQNKYIHWKITEKAKTNEDGLINVEIILPTRTMSVRLKEQKSPASHFADLYLNPNTRDESRRIAIIAHIKNHPGNLYETNFQFRHPALTTNEYGQLTSEVSINDESTGKIFKGDAHLYLNKQPSQRITFYSELYKKSPVDLMSRDYIYRLGAKKVPSFDVSLSGNTWSKFGNLGHKINLGWLEGEKKEEQILLSAVDLNNKNIIWSIKSPLSSSELKANWRSVLYDNTSIPVLKVMLEARYNNDVLRRGSLDLSSEPYINFKYSSNPAISDKEFLVYVGPEDDQIIRVLVERLNEERVIKYLDGTLTLLRGTGKDWERHPDPQELELKAYYKSGFFKELLQKTGGLIPESYLHPKFISQLKEVKERIRSGLSHEWPEVLKQINEDWSNIKADIQDARSFEVPKKMLLKLSNVTPFGHEMLRSLGDGSILKSAAENIRAILQAWRRDLAERSALAMNSLVQGLPNLPKHLRAWKNAVQAWKEAAEKNYQGLKQLQEEVFRYTGSTKTLEALQNKLREWLDELLDFGQAFLHTMLEIFFDFANNFRLKAVIRKYVQWGQELYDDLTKFLEQLYRGSLIYQEIVNFFKEIQRKVGENFDRLRVLADKRNKALRADLKLIAKEAEYLPALEQFFRVLRRFAQAFLEIVEANQPVKVSDKVTDLKELVRTVQALSTSTVNKLEIGQLEATIRINGRYRTMTDVRNAAVMKYIKTKRLTDISQRLTVDPDDVDDIEEEIPPLDGQAVVIGNKHFISFDGRHFEFSGDCEYLLTQDAVDGNFSVVVNYDNGQVKSLIVIADNHNVEVKTGYKVGDGDIEVQSPQIVLVDDAQVQLPKKVGNIKITKEGDATVVRTNEGFELTVDHKTHLALVDINGFYHGKTQGLLGTYDFEKYNDQRGPKGEINDSITDFVKSWVVSKQCSSHDNREGEPVHARQGSPAQRVCHGLFKDKLSNLMDAFDYVNVEPYHEACLQELGHTQQQSKPTKDVCQIVSAYIAIAEKRGIELDPPGSCSKPCSLEVVGSQISKHLNMINDGNAHLVDL